MVLISSRGDRRACMDNEFLYDWKPSEEKQQVIKELAEKAELEKEIMPELLSREDLKNRWQMNSRQSVHHIASRRDFPRPILIFNHGKTPLYLATEITMFEIENPWLATPENRANYSNWIFKNIIANDSDN